MFVLRVVRYTPDRVGVQLIVRTPDGDASRGYIEATQEEWKSDAWKAIRSAAALIEKQPATPHTI